MKPIFKNYRVNYVVPVDGTTEILTAKNREKAYPYRWLAIVPEFAQRISQKSYPKKYACPATLYRW